MDQGAIKDHSKTHLLTITVRKITHINFTQLQGMSSKLVLHEPKTRHLQEWSRSWQMVLFCYGHYKHLALQVLQVLLLNSYFTCFIANTQSLYPRTALKWSTWHLQKNVKVSNLSLFQIQGSSHLLRQYPEPRGVPGSKFIRQDNPEPRSWEVSTVRWAPRRWHLPTALNRTALSTLTGLPAPQNPKGSSCSETGRYLRDGGVPFCTN